MKDESVRFWHEHFPAAFAEGEHYDPALTELMQPEDLSPETVRRWMRHVLSSGSLSPTAWARSAGLAPSTVNRFIEGGAGPRNLSATTIGALAHAYQKHLFDRLETKSKELSIDPLTYTWGVSVIAALKIGDPREVFEWSEESSYVLRIPLNRDLVGPPTFAFRTDSTFDRFPSGSLLIGSPAPTISWNFRAGQTFLVHQRTDSKRAQVGLRKLSIDPGGEKWLTAPGTRALFLDDLRQGEFFMDDDILVSMFLHASLVPESWISVEAASEK